MDKDYCYNFEPSNNYKNEPFTIKDLASIYTRVTDKEASNNINYLIIDCLLSRHSDKLIPNLEHVSNFPDNTQLLRTVINVHHFDSWSEYRRFIIFRVDNPIKPDTTMTLFNALIKYDYSGVFKYIVSNWKLFYISLIDLIEDVFYCLLTYDNLFGYNLSSTKTYESFMNLLKNIKQTTNVNKIEILNKYQKNNKIYYNNHLYRFIQDDNGEYQIRYGINHLDMIMRKGNFSDDFDKYENQFSDNDIKWLMIQSLELSYNGTYETHDYIDIYLYLFKKGYQLNRMPGIKNILNILDNIRKKKGKKILRTLHTLLPINTEVIINQWFDDVSNEYLYGEYQQLSSYKKLIEYNGNFGPIDFKKIGQRYAEVCRNDKDRYELTPLLFLGLKGSIVVTTFRMNKRDEIRQFLQYDYSIDILFKQTKCTPKIETWKYNFKVMLRFQNKTRFVENANGLLYFEFDDYYNGSWYGL